MVGEKKEIVSFELEREYVDKIKEIAAKDDGEVSQIVRLCVIEGLRSIYGPIRL